jgi:hypothetical protein
MVFSVFWMTRPSLWSVLILIISHAHIRTWLSEQKPLRELLPALVRMFDATTANERQGQVRRLNDWFKIAFTKKG